VEDKINPPMPYSEILPAYGHGWIRDLFRDANKLQANAEYESVKRGMREASMYHLNPQDYDRQIDQIMKDGLAFQSIRRVKTAGGFSHTHQDGADLGPDTLVYGVLARDLDVAVAIVKASQPDKSGDADNVSIGELLGYPECCRKAFAEFWKTTYDPVFEIALNTPGCKADGNTIIIERGDPRLYVHFRYFGVRIIPWFPCSFNCEASIELAEKWSALMYDIDPETTEALLGILPMESKWDLLNSQIVVNHPYFMGRATSYYTEANKIVVFK